MPESGLPDPETQSLSGTSQPPNPNQKTHKPRRHQPDITQKQKGEQTNEKRTKDWNEEETTRERTSIGCEIWGGWSCLADSGSSLLKFSLLLFYLIFPSSLFFHFNCCFSSSLLLSSLVVASMYSLLFLSSFRFWGVFHKWSLRPPPLADLALPYLLFLMCEFPSLLNF